MVENAPITNDDRDADRARDAQWVQEARRGDLDAFGHLYDAWIDRVFNVVARIVRDRETAREVCQDAFLSAWRGLGSLEDPQALGGWLLRIARNAALNRAAREDRSRPVDDQGLAVIEGTRGSPVSAPAGFGVESRLSRAEDPDVAVADGEVASLVRETVAALGERDAEVLDLQLRYGLTPAEIGEVVGLNRNAANQLCHRARSRFAAAFGVRMLWNGSRPACAGLQQELTAAGVTAFGPDALALADQHATTCDACEERRTARLQPSALFAALPLLIAPAPLKAEIAAELAAHGVPMTGSTAAPAPPPSSPPMAGPADGSSLPPPPPPPTTRASAGSWPPRSIARRMLPAAAAAVMVVLLVASLLATRDSSNGTELLADGATTTTAGSSAPVGTDGAGSDTDPGDGDAQPPTTVGTVTTDPAPADSPAPVIELFELEPADPQPNPFIMGQDSPTMRWQVADASEVNVWMWFDDGTNGARPVRVISTEASGELNVCPGTESPPDSCEAAPGRYSYLVEATNADGVTVSSDPENRPSFEVYTVIE